MGLPSFYAFRKSCARLPFQAEVDCGQRRELNVQAPLPVLPRDVLRPDFAEVTHIGSAEHGRIRVEDFFPGSAGGAFCVVS